MRLGECFGTLFAKALEVVKMKFTDSKGRRIEIAIQLLTTISVVVGVFLVVLELKQTRENAFNEIIQTRMDTVIQETSLIYGANLAGVLAKACHTSASGSHLT